VSYEPFFRQLTIDWRVLTFATGIAVISPLAFAILPTLAVLRRDVRQALTDASSRTVGGRGSGRAQAALVIVQVTVAVALFSLSALIVQSVSNLTRVDPGYAVDGLLSTHIEVPTWKVRDDAAVADVRQAITERIAHIGRVRGVTTVSELAGLHLPAGIRFAIASQPETDDLPLAGLTVTTPSYFDVLQIGIVAGRGFEEADAVAAPVAIVSAEAARRYFGGVAAAIGQQISLRAGAGVTATVVGVARDVPVRTSNELQPPQIYLLDVHRPARGFYVIVRAERPEAIAEEVRAAIHAVDPELAAYELRTVNEAFADENSSDELIAGLFGAFALVAVLLATAGLYALMSHGVSRRQQEIAVRVALGASQRRIATLVIGRSLTLAATGIGLGLALAFVLAQPVRAMLFGVGPADPATYAAAAVVTLLAALLAAYVPMRRALHVQPAVGLR
jgi:putative ABC transport system permease protein